MVSLRPHTITFNLPGTPGGEDANGFPTEETPGELVQLPCRFVAGGQRRYKNEDSVEIQQKGRIRVDVGSPVPVQGQEVVVVEGDRELFKGPAMEIYTGGRLTGWRIDV